MTRTTNNADTAALATAPSTNVAAIPKLDSAKYMAVLEDCELSDAQKAEVLQTLWFIMATFVDWGFGVDSVTMALPALAEFTSSADSDALDKASSASGTLEHKTKKGTADG
jgi:hypothetical protein